MKDGSEKPVAYASRTLSTAKRTHGHLDKEALAVVKLHPFLFGRHFKIYTDPKPLFGLLKPEWATPLMASSRMQQSPLTFLAHEYELICHPAEQNGNADALSCLPLSVVPETTPILGDITHLLETINSSPVDATKLKLWTTHNPVLT